jgi:hypothetical protein
MKKNRRKIIGVATCLFVLVTSGLFTSMIQQHVVATDIQQNDDEEKVVVQIMDESYTKEIVVVLTKQKASELETVIEAVLKKSRTATSQEEIREIYCEALRSFQSLGLFIENVNQDKILRIFEREHPAYLSYDVIQAGQWKINWNAFCYIIGDTTNSLFTGIRFTILDRIATYLQHQGLGSYIISLMGVIWLLDNIKPFSVWHRIYLGQFSIPGGINPAEGWIITCGLTGLRKWNGSLTGNVIKDSWYDSTGVIGFTGIKIMHKDFYRSFYLGTALLVSISQ